jgi:hypothetical protein
MALDATLATQMTRQLTPASPWLMFGVGLASGAAGVWLYQRHLKWLELALVLPFIPP